MNNLHRRCWAEIDGSGLQHNLRFLRSKIDKTTSILAVVKANGFGHGMIPMARELLAQKVFALGVAHLHEAAELREAGVNCPLMLLSAALPSEFPEIIRLRAWPMISTLTEAQALDRAARKQKKIAEAHFKMDTGMGRLGLWGDEAAEALEAILRLRHLNILGVATHLSRADDDAEFTAKQLWEFSLFKAQFPDLPFHVGNSAASCQGLARGSDMIRIGLALYGIPPTPPFRRFLQPLLSWKSRITLIRHLPAGRTISYGATYRLPKPQTLATIAVGYGDGYPRALSNVGEVLIGGRRCPIRGRVTMDQIVVDITKVPQARVEDEVVLIGTQGAQNITIDQLAGWANTISYDVATAISARVPRVYRKWKTKF